MPVYPVVPESPLLTGAYPHLERRDAALWERFLVQHVPPITGVAYDVALGGQVPDDPNATPEQLLGWQYSTAQRVDVVAFTADEVWVIEVKPNARLGALGQVLGYVLLFEREPITTLPLVPTLVTDNLSPDVRYVADQLNIQVFVV